MSYRDKVVAHKKHLRSEYWKSLRHKAQLRAAFKCEVCGELEIATYGLEPFHLHHKTYKNFGKEKLDDVMYMCPECHVEEHKKKDAPKISQIRLSTPKQPKPKTRRKKKKRKYGYTSKEKRILSKFKVVRK